MKVATLLVPLTEVLSIYRNTSLLSGEGFSAFLSDAIAKFYE